MYLKATVAGLLTAILFGVTAMVIEGYVVLHAVNSASSGSAGIGAVSVGAEAAAPGAVAGFILGFFMVVRRARRRFADR
jgi:hypothetical protein